MAPPQYFLAIFLVILAAWRSGAHPLCSDTTTAVPQPTLAYCTMYREDSCCNEERDVEIEQAIEALDISPEFSSCIAFMKNSTCTECDPWAAHLRGELNDARDVPILCPQYCEAFYNACKNVTMTNGYPFFTTQIGDQTMEDFCAQYSGPADTYCFDGSPYDPGEGGLYDSPNGICVDRVIEEDTEGPSGFITMAAMPGDRIVVATRQGLGKIYRITQTPPFQDLGVFLDLTDKIETNGEGGWLGIAFHPNYAVNGRFFVSYTCGGDECPWECTSPDDCVYGGDCVGNECTDHNKLSVVAEYSVSSGDPDRADPVEVKRIYEVSQPGGNHNGGQLLFGPEGYLYIFFGDGGGYGGDGSQDMSMPLGKILRIDVDSNPDLPFVIPPDNPFADSSDPNILKEIYASGFRNPWRNSFDRETGELYVGDVGQNTKEEVDLIIPGGNYGWKRYEGTIINEEDLSSPTESETTFPVIEYDHAFTEGDAACVIGGHIYRGPKDLCHVGVYVFGDETLSGENAFFFGNTSSGDIQKASWVCGSDSSNPISCQGQSIPRISSFAEDYYGNLYFLTSGSVYQLISIDRCPSLHCFYSGGSYNPPPTYPTASPSTVVEESASERIAPFYFAITVFLIGWLFHH